jgi:hypothetical protein
VASKIDGVLKDLKKLAEDVSELKRAVVASPIVPLPAPLKSKLGVAQEIVDQQIIDAYFGVAGGVADVVLPASVAREVINNPNVLMDTNGSISQIPASRRLLNTAKSVQKPRKVTKKMKMQRKIQSKAFRNANAKARKKDGTLRAGFDQSRIARMAQRECTKERQRLGLCDKPMKRKSTRKGQVRKTARRAYEK